MKKALIAAMALTLTMAVAPSALAANSVVTPTEYTQASTQQTTQLNKIVWEHAGDLEAQFGQEANIGTAGLLAGTNNGYLLFGGGANFPGGTPATGAAKCFWPDLYVMKDVDGQLELVNHTSLSYEIGYGVSITTPQGIYYVGGSPDNEKACDILLFNISDDGQVNAQKVGTLPFTFSDGFAVMQSDLMYIGAGKQDGKATNRTWSYNVRTGECKELAPIPGADTRTQCVAQALNGRICVFSGGDAVAYTDGYSYNIATNSWTRLADVQIGQEKISLLGAQSVKLNNEEMLVIGGFNKEVYDDAVYQLGNLQGDELQAFKDVYFNADSHTFKWNKKVLIYNATTNQWRSVGEVPFPAPCGEGLVLQGNKIYSVNGEIKPGTRSNRTYSGTLVFN